MPTWKVTFIKKVVGVCHQYLGSNPGAQVSKLRPQLLLYPGLPWPFNDSQINLRDGP